MQKYTETEMNPKESLIEYEYHIDDITLLGFKILKLPLKQSDLPTWFSNSNDIADMTVNHIKYSKEYIYNRLSVGDCIIYDSRYGQYYTSNYDNIVNVLNAATGYVYELLLDAAFESDSNSSDKKVDTHLPVTTTEKDNINPNHYKFGDMEHSITKTVNSGCITQYMYTVGELTLFGFKIMEIPLKEHDLPIWFLNFMDKKGVFVTHDSYEILISGMENEYNRVCERSSKSFVDRIYNCLRVGDYIVYDPRFDDVYATNSDGFIKLLETISEYTLELDTCSEDASALDDMANNMKISDLSSDLNGDPGTITAGVIETKKDNNNPSHYKFGDMESMPFIDAVTEFGEFRPVETPHVKDAIKYLIRYPRKNGLEDLKKAQWFINHLIEVREKIESSIDNQYGSSIIKLNANESMKFIELMNTANPFTGKIGDLDDIDRKKLAERMKGEQDACR